MVHQSRKNNVAVVAFLYKIGNPDPFLAKVQLRLKTANIFLFFFPTYAYFIIPKP